MKRSCDNKRCKIRSTRSSLIYHTDIPLVPRPSNKLARTHARSLTSARSLTHSITSVRTYVQYSLRTPCTHARQNCCRRRSRTSVFNRINSFNFVSTNCIRLLLLWPLSTLLYTIHQMKCLLSLRVALLLILSTQIAAFCQRTNASPTRTALNVATTPIPSNMSHHQTSTSTPLEIKEFPEEALQFDHYSGVAVHVKHLQGPVLTNSDVFSRVLESSLEMWAMEQRRGIWIHIPKSHGHLIAVR